MEQKSDGKNIFKQSRLFRYYILLLTLINAVYVAIEIYKAKISEPMLASGRITKFEYTKLETLSTYALYFESAFIILTIISILVITTKKLQPFLKSFLVIHLIYLVILFMVSNLLSWIFHAPAGNLDQQLIGPFVILLGVHTYFFVKSIFGRIIKVKRV